MGLPRWLSNKAFTCTEGDMGSIPGSGGAPGAGHGNPFQDSFLENHMDRGAWQATVHRVAKSWTRLKQFSRLAYIYLNTLYIIHTHTHTHI